jgi:hypothetical protein
MNCWMKVSMNVVCLMDCVMIDELTDGIKTAKPLGQKQESM